MPHLCALSAQRWDSTDAQTSPEPTSPHVLSFRRQAKRRPEESAVTPTPFPTVILSEVRRKPNVVEGPLQCGGRRGTRELFHPRLLKRAALALVAPDDAVPTPHKRGEKWVTRLVSRGRSSLATRSSSLKSSQGTAPSLHSRVRPCSSIARLSSSVSSPTSLFRLSLQRGRGLGTWGPLLRV